MNKREIWEAVEMEVRRAKKKFPNWPDHVVAQAAIVAEESGELIRAALQYKYERNPNEVVQDLQREDLKKEAIQTAAMAIRFLENLPE